MYAKCDEMAKNAREWTRFPKHLPEDCVWPTGGLNRRLWQSGQVSERVDPLRGRACLPDQLDQLDGLAQRQRLMQEEDTRAMTSARQERPEVGGHRVVVV